MAARGFVRISPDDDGASRLHGEWGNTNARTLPEPLMFVVHHGRFGSAYLGGRAMAGRCGRSVVDRM